MTVRENKKIEKIFSLLLKNFEYVPVQTKDFQSRFLVLVEKIPFLL